MKKIYNAPVVRVYNVTKTSVMLNTSDTTLSSSDFGSEGSYTINAKEERQSVGSVWDNEW